MGAFKKSHGKVILIAQEIELARELASNNKITRDKALRKLKKWFISRSQGLHKFEKHDFLRIWKGLFYCMWMSDKPLIQEDLAEEISILVHSLDTVNTAIKFTQAGFAALALEWSGIDDLRINKFMMLVRRIVRQSFVVVQRRSWDEEDVNALANMYYTVLSETDSLGLKLHLIELYCEELAKIGGEDLPSDVVLNLTTPFARFMAKTKDGRLISHITRHVFLHLIHQSDAGIEYEAKFNAWKQLGFPGGSIDAMQKAGPEETDGDDDFKYAVDGEEEEEEPKQTELDPRAGRINVELPTLTFDPKAFVSMFTMLKSSQETTVKARKTIVNVIQKFEKLSEGKFPLGIQKVDLPEVVPLKKEIIRTSKKLLKKQLKESKNDLSDESDDDLPRKTKSKKPKVKSKWSVTETVEEKNAKVGKENIDRLKKTKSWQVKLSGNKRKESDDNSLGKETQSLRKRQKLNSSLNFQISEIKEQKNVGNKIKTEHKLSAESETSKVKLNKEANKDSVQSNTSSVEHVVVNKILKKKKNPDLNSSASVKDNVSLTETKNVSSEWDLSLKEGETEIFVPSKKYLKKVGEKRGSAAMAALLRHHLGESPDKIVNPFALSPRNKRVEFALGLNTSQEHKEYRRSLKRKSDIPFDALNLPKKSVLKTTPVGSPINPFYRINDDN